jgi:hypothetical protein
MWGSTPPEFSFGVTAREQLVPVLAHPASAAAAEAIDPTTAEAVRELDDSALPLRTCARSARTDSFNSSYRLDSPSDAGATIASIANPNTSPQAPHHQAAIATTNTTAPSTFIARTDH